MNVLKTASLLLIGLAIAGHASADEAQRSSGLSEFGIAPEPSTLAKGNPQTKPLEVVIDMIRLRLPGRALGAQMIEWQGRPAYEIRWIGDDGVVRDITADAMNGDILNER